MAGTVLLCSVALMLPGCGGPSGAGPASSSVTIITDANFQQVTSKGVVLVDFWAAWCPPCRTQGPIVEEVAGQYKGLATIGKLDVDKNRQTAGRFSVRSIPTLIIFKDGKVFRRLVGLRSKEQLSAALDEALGRN